MSIEEAEPFLRARVEIDDTLPTLLGLCAGYETGKWRSAEFARYLIDHLYEFIFPLPEWKTVNSTTGVRMLRRAAEAVYKTEKHANRGEIGELMLFAIMRAHYGSLPVVSKLYFKTSANDTVKGFDAVHFVDGEDGMELWLGEVKFYTEPKAAIRDVLKEMDDHLQADYLRGEFIWIGNQMAAGTPRYEEIRRLLDERTSLDEIFDILHVPVLLTYESPVVAAHAKADKAFREAIAEEIRAHFETFRKKCMVKEVAVHLILVPMHSKADLQDAFDKKLKLLQEL